MSEGTKKFSWPSSPMLRRISFCFVRFTANPVQLNANMFVRLAFYARVRHLPGCRLHKERKLLLRKGHKDFLAIGSLGVQQA
jgi:hypothetical protein